MEKFEEKYDVLIVGAGPIGLACAIEARKRNLSHLIIEKGALVNSLFHYPTNMTFFSTSDRLEIGGVPFISHGMKPTRRESLEYYRRVAGAWKLNTKIYERVVEIAGAIGNFQVLTEKGSYQSRTVIIATGYYDNANMLNVPGEQLPKVKHYYDEPHLYAYQKVAVIGAANSAIDVALETYRVGAEVTMIIREPALSDRIKYWVKPDIENRIKEGSINAHFNAEVTAIRENEIDIRTKAGMLRKDKITLENDFVFAMTGYHPDYDFLERVGIEVKQDDLKNPVFNPETFETNQKGMFLAGVVCGGMDTAKLFIENSREHATKIFDYLEPQLKSLKTQATG